MTYHSNKDSKTSTCLDAPMVVFDKVGLCFQRHSSIFDLFFKSRGRVLNFWALQELSFSLYKGETLGVIGRNGSGKSTLSLICTQVYRHDTGTVLVNGKVQLLALGVGFQIQLSGRENVFISGSLLGLNTSEIRQRMAEIENFADIGDFMDEPVRTYSSGMRSRLGFAIATTIRPDILILDEVLATGDKAFQGKAMERMKNLHTLAKCAIIISHSSRQLQALCNRVLWIEKGRMVMLGKPAEVLDSYTSFCKNPNKWKTEHPECF